MKWTKDRPTEEGVYLTWSPGYSPHIFWVTKYRRETLFICDTVMNIAGSFGENTYFMGPIPEPEDI